MWQREISKKHEYKIALILKYFDEVKESYSYNEIMEIFGFTFTQLQQQLILMQNLDLLKIKDFFILTEEGYNILEKFSLNEIMFDNFDFEEDNIFTEKQLSIEDIYIPKSFEKKYNIG